jgi:HEPN domain-containing protein
MSRPQDRHARLFYRSTLQRDADARFLLDGGRTTGAIYLAGYAVECILKALILSSVPESQRTEILSSFRGARAHDYNWLREPYRDHGGATFPANVARCFALVNTWSTDLRYQPGTALMREAEEFLRAAQVIIEWADGRL